MLNKNNERELAYLVRIEAITPMNADRLECAHIGGWHCVVGKGEFKVGDPAVYFEIDSQLPDVEPFSSMEFLKSKNFKIKSQRIRGEVSQGLLMPVTAFGWAVYSDLGWGVDADENGIIGAVDISNENELHHDVFRLDDESRFLTQRLGVTYADPGDNVRKGSAPDKYKKMSQRHPNIFKKKWARWLMKREWGRKLMFLFFGKKKDKKGTWPYWVVKTDEERIQNCAWILNDTEREWIPTEKIDGSSTTFTLHRKGLKKEFFVCSRNVVFDKPDKKCYYDTNIYTEMAEKYHMEDKMKAMWEVKEFSEHQPLEFLTIQAETYGAGVQKRDYGMKDHDMAIFNIIFGYKDGRIVRLNPIEGVGYTMAYGLPYVPVLGTAKTLPNDCEAVLALAESEPSQIDGGMREGIVFRSTDGQYSFKAVSNAFLLKYHQ